jgi:hypothetical protein
MKMKKKYEAPELEVVILEQSDIITVSGPKDGFATTNGTNNGKWHDNWS